MKRKIEFMRGWLAVVAIILVPRIAFEAIQFINNKAQPSLLGWLAIILGAAVLFNTATLQKGGALGNALTLKGQVLLGLLWMRVWVGGPTPTLVVAFIGTAIGLVGVRVGGLRPPGVSASSILKGVDSVRLSAVALLVLSLHLAKGGSMPPVGLVVTGIIILWPAVACAVAGQAWMVSVTGGGGRTLAGTTRWILGFIVAGVFIGWASQGYPVGMLGPMLLASVSYAFFAWLETPERGPWTLEALGVAGSGVANVAHLALFAPASVGPVLAGYGLVCAGVVFTILVRQNR